MDAYWDTADSYRRILRVGTTAQRPALRALLDLPADWPIARVSTVAVDLNDGAMNVTETRLLTAAAALRQLASGDIAPDEVLELLTAQGAIRPDEGGAAR